jgi:hypothetical protein
MMESVERTLEQLYPTKTWGELDDDACGGSLTGEELAGLADELASTLGAATFVREGVDEPCDFIYVLCMGRTPCVVQVRDHDVAPPDEWETTPGSITELYLRICISQRTRVAAIQQVAIDLVRTPDGDYIVHERPRAGVYDAPLLPRMQRVVAILPAYELLHVDFGEIAHAPPGFEAGEWRALYGGEPAIANYLFYALPTTSVVSTTLQGPRVQREPRRDHWPGLHA